MEPMPLTRSPKPLLDAEILRAGLASPSSLHLAGSESYLRVRWFRTWNIDAVGSPSAIVVPETEEDVSFIVRFCNERPAHVTLGVCCGRHSSLSMKDDVLVMDMQKFNRVEIQGPYVSVGGGCLLGEVDAACHPHKVACTFGTDPTTGVGGLTLNGGHGFLERKYGMTVDSLVSARVVLASGEIVTASNEVHSDLFYAIQGGGGNFGVVVEFVFRPHKLPNDGHFAGGVQVFSKFEKESPAELMDRWAKTILKSEDNALNGMMSVSGRAVVLIWWYIDEIKRANEFFASHIWPYGEPQHDDTRKNAEDGGRCYWTEVQKTLPQVMTAEGENTSRNRYYLSSQIAVDLTPQLIAEMADAAGKGIGSIVVVPISGKAKEFDNGCIPSRAGNWWIFPMVTWGKGETDPAVIASQRERAVGWVKDFTAKIAPLCAVGTYGTLYTHEMMDESSLRSRSVYGHHLERLREIKAKYDAKNIFHVNHNISPFAK